MKADHPYKKATKLPYILSKKMYWPPVSGIIAATSALLNAPKSVITPAKIQTATSHRGEPSCEAIKAGFIKMPEPITPPATMAILVHKPSVGFNFWGDDIRSS